MSDPAAVVTLGADGRLPGWLAGLGEVAVLLPPGAPAPEGERCVVRTAEPRSSAAVAEVLRWFERARADHLAWLLDARLDLPPRSLGRLQAAAEDAGAALAYSDHFELGADGLARPHPVIDHQPGSLRDDFDFGPLLLCSRPALTGLAGALSPGLRTGGLYDLRLRLTERGPVLHLPEPLGLAPARDLQPQEQRQFDYVDPRRREHQLEMERVATAYLERLGARLPPPTEPPAPDPGGFPVEASVVIPVRDRVATIGQAVRSALEQRAGFDFNVIVVDNRSTDGTTERLTELAARDRRLVHLRPARVDLGIGGCWNEAIDSPACGRYAVQLDSDDLYAGPDVLARMVEALRDGPCAMAIGAYSLVDFDLNPIPPGLIDHREWTDQNGHNNALRVAGLGAPRAFHVPTLRRVGFPNVSYGEDYAVGLRLCRSWRVARIFDSLYLCRRWAGNTDSGLPLETHNRHQAYKDRLRSIELAARQALLGGRR